MSGATKSKQIEFNSFEDFLAWERAGHNTIDFKVAYTDLAGDIDTGLLLSQIIYWHLPSHDGSSKLRVQKNGHYWIAKTRYEWWDEIRLNPRQVDRAKKVLQTKGLIIVEQHLFNGMKIDHYRLVPEVLLPALQEVIEHPPVNPYRTRSDPKQPCVTETGTSGSPMLQGRSNENNNARFTKASTPITETTTAITSKTTLERGTAVTLRAASKNEGTASAKPQLSYAASLPTPKREEKEEGIESGPAPWMHSLARAIECNVNLDRSIQTWLAQPIFERLDKAGRACVRYVTLIAEYYQEFQEESGPIPTGHLISAIDCDLDLNSVWTELANIPLDQL